MAPVRPPLLVRVTAALTIVLAGCALPGVPSLPDPGPAQAPPAATRGDDPSVAETAAPGYPHWADGGAGSGDCFARHLEEAIGLNERRLPLYARLSDGASEPVSRRLIRSERAALPVAWYVDQRARAFQVAGIPIGCAEFVSMALTPAPALGGADVRLRRADPDATPGPPGPGPAPGTDPGPGLDPDSLEAALVGAYASSGFAGVLAAAHEAHAALARRPAYHCMTRHLIESIARVAALAPYHAAAARSRGLPSTAPLSELLLRLHLATLADGAELDRSAAPLQRAGIPILCRDVPPIPSG